MSQEWTAGRDELGPGPGRVTGQAATFAYLAVFGQDAVIRGDQAQVGALFKELRVDLQRWLIDESRRVQRRDHLCPLGGAEPVRRRRRGH